jgi:23S rRNA-/tRNA-specific pseudouridylate synthase
VAVDKPARMHSAPGLGGGDLCGWVFERYPETRDLRPETGALAGRPGHSGRGEGGLLHRLDYETSGLVLFARTPGAFVSLLDQQTRGEFAKEYVALSSPSREAFPRASVPPMRAPGGVDPQAWGSARDALDVEALSVLLAGAAANGSCGIGSAFRSRGPKGASVACIEAENAAGGRVYRSEVLGCRPLSIAYRRGGSKALELRLRLVRGFRHQLRAQLAWIGLPIDGDPLYGGREDLRLRLYAVRLSFLHPGSGEPVSLSLGE